VHVQDGLGPPEFALVQGVDANGEGVVKTRNSGDVPGITGQGACAETALVIGKIADDRFDNLQGKSGGRGIVCCRSLRRNAP
jgi:hypothetical protein